MRHLDITPPRTGARWAGPLLAAALLLGAGCGREGRPNVLIITIDTLRADHVGAYGYGPARTPSLDRLAREGVRCADAVAAAPITLPSHSSIFTGLYPPAHGVRDNGAYALSDRATTLAERLKATGYRTQAFVSALVLNRRYNLSQGFEGYDDDLWSEDEPALFMVRDRPAPRTAERAVRWLQGWDRDNRDREPSRKPFFLWVHFYDPHQPYKAPAAELLRSPTPYDAEIALADQGVGKILDELQRASRLDDTLVVLTADHGESLGEHGEKTHGVFLYDATVRVPLLLRWPGRLPAGKVYAGPVRLVDLVPTVLAALGLPGGNETQGVSLLPALRGETAPPLLPQYSESLLSEVGFGMAPLYGLRLGGTQWIRAPRPEIYDLKRDPRELRNLYAQDPRLGARLDRELEKILEDSRRRALPAAPSPMDRETLETLQALGYLAPRSQREAVAGMDPKDGILLYDKLEDARHLAQRGRWAQSEALLREILAVTPRNLTARNILALARWRQGDPAGARQEYLKVLAEDPRQSRVYAMLGNLALAEGDLAEAERRFREAIGITPGFVEALSNLGMIQALRDDEAGAEAWYDRALAADPGFPRGTRRLADLYYERGEYAKAFPLYRKTLEGEPGDFAALVQAGNCARRTGDPKSAAGYFDQAARLRPDSWVPLYNLACLRAVGGDPRAALALLEKAVGKGFHRDALLAEDEDLVAVRRLPGYASILAKARRADGGESAR